MAEQDKSDSVIRVIRLLFVDTNKEMCEDKDRGVHLTKNFLIDDNE